MTHFFLGLVVLACMGFAFYVEYVSRGAASTVTHSIAAGAMFLAVACALPMRVRRAVDSARRIVPGLDRRSREVPHVIERRLDDGEA